MYSSNYDNLFVALGAFALIIGLIVLAVLVVYLVAFMESICKSRQTRLGGNYSIL